MKLTLLEYIEDPRRRKALVAALGTSNNALWQVAARWRGKRPSPQRAIEIERLTGGVVTKSSLRPDLWPEIPRVTKRRRKAA